MDLFSLYVVRLSKAIVTPRQAPMDEKAKPTSIEPAGSRLWVGPLAWFFACIIVFISFWLGGFLRGAQINIYTIFLYGFFFCDRFAKRPAGTGRGLGN
jgi:hypothetical protein